MRKFFSFWWLCTRRAFWGNATFANDWQWVFGNPIVSTFGAAVGALIPAVAQRLGVVGLTTGIPTLDSFLGALAAFIVTWLVSFFSRLLNAPVLLFHQEKLRADALEGVLPEKPPPTDKNLPKLKERYLSQQLQIDRELLDYLVDGIQAIEDVTLIFNGLTKSTTKLGKSIAQHTRRANTKNFEKRRLIVSRMAADLDSYSEQVDEYVEIFRVLSPRLLEYTSQFIERGPKIAKENYLSFARTVGGNAKSAAVVIDQVSLSQKLSDSLRGITADLNAAVTRYDAAIARLLAEIGEYKKVCETLEEQTTRKAEDL